MVLEDYLWSPGVRVAGGSSGVGPRRLWEYRQSRLHEQQGEIVNALHIAFAVYLPVFVAGLVAIITCLFAGRRHWSKWPCTAGLAVTGPLLLLLTGLFLEGAVATGGYHGEAGMAGSILFLALIPVGVEFLSLLALAWRLGLLRRKSGQPEL
jgi:hypothetical protein